MIRNVLSIKIYGNFTEYFSPNNSNISYFPVFPTLPKLLRVFSRTVITAGNSRPTLKKKKKFFDHILLWVLVQFVQFLTVSDLIFFIGHLSFMVYDSIKYEGIIL